MALRMLLGNFVYNLPKFTSDVNRITIITYGEINGYGKNQIITNQKGQEIFILCGKSVNPSRDRKIVSEKINDSGGISKNPFIILYAGLSSAQMMIELAYSLAAKRVKVALVGCGCDEHIFDELKPNEYIYYVMPLHQRCNKGKEDLAKIVQKLLEP